MVETTQTLATTSTVTTTMIARFEPVDGGVGRACRGSSSSDNSAQYFDVAWRIGPACRESLAPHGATLRDETHTTAGNNWKPTIFSTHQHRKLPKDGSSYFTVVVYQPSPCVSQVVSVPTLDECKELCTMKQEPPKPTASTAPTSRCKSHLRGVPKTKIHQNPSKIQNKTMGFPGFPV